MGRMGAFYQQLRFMRPRFFQQVLLIMAYVFCTVSVAFAAITDDEIESALQQAESLQLAQHETWLALLHYKRETLSRRYISQADDENFFLAAKGKTDANAELQADINAFLKGPHSGHAQCRFPARWWWIKQQLNLQGKHEVSCPQHVAFMTRVAQDKLFLVFPTMYLNNPGSTFGHTFLRFDGENESVLLSQTLNYAARVDKQDDLLSYVSKGLFGGYTGFFKTRAYYETVQEYSNIENRDIWEYQLAFTKDEITQLARHLWEIKGIDFDYYFFRENCAYRLLALIDVIRPGMRLTGENAFPVYAIPVDTVRALDDRDLIISRQFRASLATKINQGFVEDEDVSSVVIDIISAQLLADSDTINKKLRVLRSDSEKLEALKRSIDILQFRGRASSNKAKVILLLINNYASSEVENKRSVGLTDKKSPEKGHNSLRVSAGYGEQNNKQYVDIQFRPAFHDLLDAPQGFIDGAAINVFDFRFKWFTGFDDDAASDARSNLRLESLSLINVTSLNPVKQWITPISWLFDIRLDRTQLSDTQSVRNFISRGGVGLSFKWQRLMPFVLFVGEGNFSSSYAKGYSLLLGAHVGFYYNHDANQFMLSYEVDNAVAGFELDRNITQVQWQYNLQVNHAVRLHYKHTSYDFYDDEDWSVVYNYYF
ncbi:MAG: hypothetical protein COB77_00445 [Gammaproteobacteria bacterium]|nr:MAG: hypothetical protein COB77_00445 [Gammaproteobacteria bacterium]